MTLRVVQWNTGIVGANSVRGVVAHPKLELVGCFAHGPEKKGVDVGTLCGIEPLGVQASADAEALLALRPDCVIYAPLFPDVELMVRMLEAGINVVSTSYFITGRSFGEEQRQRLETAARRGGASLYGTGVNPGFANAMALAATGICQSVDRISVLESVDCTHYPSAESWRACGLGRPMDDPEIAGMAQSLTSVFQDAVEWMAGALELEVDEIRFDVEFAEATERVELGFMTIEKGCATGLRHCWSGMAGGRPVIELILVWMLGYTMKPSWPIENGYVIEIDGLPSVRARVEAFYPEESPDFGIVTAMPAVHAVPHVCAAAPGVVLGHELPMILAAGMAGSGARS